MLILTYNCQNAEVVGTGIKGTEASLNRLPIYNLNGEIVAHNRVTILDAIWDKDIVIGFNVMDEYNRIARLSYSKTIEIIRQKGATNAVKSFLIDSCMYAIINSADDWRHIIGNDLIRQLIETIRRNDISIQEIIACSILTDLLKEKLNNINETAKNILLHYKNFINDDVSSFHRDAYEELSSIIKTDLQVDPNADYVISGAKLINGAEVLVDGGNLIYRKSGMEDIKLASSFTMRRKGKSSVIGLTYEQDVYYIVRDVNGKYIKESKGLFVVDNKHIIFGNKNWIIYKDFVVKFDGIYVRLYKPIDGSLYHTFGEPYKKIQYSRYTTENTGITVKDDIIRKFLEALDRKGILN